jgi:hypothetical protein
MIAPSLQNRLKGWSAGEIALFVGIGVVCLIALILVGRASPPGREEWDSELFKWLVLPFAAVSSFICGSMYPRHSWRWALAPWWLQFVYMLIIHGPGNIWPIAIVFWGLMLLPFVALAKLGEKIAERRRYLQF